MSRTLLWGLLCTLLIGVAASWGRAQIYIGGDPATMKIDIYLRDADIPEALSALFNTTDGKYQLKLDPSVVGRVARLQMTAKPFEEVLNAILGSEFSYKKAKSAGDTYLYTITGRNSAPRPATLGAPLGAPPTDTAVAPSSSALGGTSSGTKSGSSGFPVLSYFTKPGTASSGSAAGTPGAPGTPGSTTEGEAATEELTVVKMVGINYLDLESICDALGGTTISLFNQGNFGGNNGVNNGNNNGLNNNGLNNNNNNINNGINNGLNNGLNNNNNNNNLNNRNQNNRNQNNRNLNNRVNQNVGSY